MNFKDEYKKSAESISPDREAIDRMKAAVLAKIADENEKLPEVPSERAYSAETSPRRKPLPLKRIAVIGGTVAACAVITVSAFTLLPSLKSSNNMVNEAGLANSDAEMYAAGCDTTENELGFVITSSYDADEVYEITAETSDTADTGAVSKGSVPDTDTANDADTAASITESVITAIAPVEAAQPEEPYHAEDAPAGTYEEYGGGHDGYPATGATEPDNISDTAPENSIDDSEQAEPSEAEDITDKSQTNITDNGYVPENSDSEYETDKGWETAEITDVVEDVVDDGAAETAEGSYDEAVITGEPEYAETMEVWYSQECEDVTEEAAPPEPPKLIIAKGWLTYGGKRYDLDSSVTSSMFPYSPITAANLLDEKEYYLYIDGYVLKLFDGDKKFIGLYRLRA